MSPTTSRPLVGIGVPVYNGERYLADALEALISQTYPELDIVVCDNASTDASVEIAQEFARRDPRVRVVVNPENIGAARNYRRSFELSRGDYFRWATADDLSAPEYVERCMDVLLERPDVVQAYPRTRLIDAQGNAIEDYDDGLHAVAERPSARYRQVTRRLRLVNALYGVIRSDALRRTAMLGTYIGSDMPLMAEIALYGKIWEVPEILFFRRMHASAQSAQDVLGQQRHYNPRATRAFSFRHWRHLAERQRAVLRSPISLGEKLATCGFLLRDSIRTRDEFARELKEGLRIWSAGRRAE